MDATPGRSEGLSFSWDLCSSISRPFPCVEACAHINSFYTFFSLCCMRHEKQVSWPSWSGMALFDLYSSDWPRFSSLYKGVWCLDLFLVGSVHLLKPVHSAYLVYPHRLWPGVSTSLLWWEYDTFCFCLGLIKPAIWIYRAVMTAADIYMMHCFESWYSYLLRIAAFAFFHCIVLDSMSTTVSSCYSYILSHFGSAQGAFTCWNYLHIVAEVAGSVHKQFCLFSCTLS